MASVFVYALILMVVFLVLKLLISLFTNTTKTGSSNVTIPGKTGWPIIGETIAFVTCPGEFIRQRMTRHSPDIFRTSIAGQKMVVLCGPLGNKFIFSNESKLFTPWWPQSITNTLQFPTTSEIQDDHSFLKPESLKNYVSIMDSMARDHLQANWVPFDEVKVHPLLKEFTFALACRLFVNLSCQSQVSELAEPFFAVAKGIVSAPLNIPGTPYNKAVNGGAIIKEKLIQIIRRRRREVAENGAMEYKDLLSRLLQVSSNSDGKLLSEKHIANVIIDYLIGSFYTTSTAITFVLSHLADYPHVYDKVLEEQQGVAQSKGAGEMLTWGDIQKMKCSWNVVCESMRLAPPAQGGFKEAITNFTFAGFNIPKSWKVFWSVHSTNKNPEYFPEPEKFDPSRFEGKGPAPYTFVPFGGGPRMCAGKEYARIEILVFVHNVVTRFRLKKASPSEKITYNPEPVPSQGLRMHLLPHDQ